ncbi:hypothetical protein SGFS_063390 [Streptomyces graminofaciens]|uniref:Uncharacterized protein n=1 Tax=Streptomyces graminofaciens TaxID=68212 RepID=A0ABN5VR72_9ACTN|nr:hypothetical protein [Streptomyces graminofaciens]BBC35045.1 hypothetical protein SGFS_063390 [Streptomyces graminofaciens]
MPFDFAAATSLVHRIHHPDPTWWNDLPKITAPTLVIDDASAGYTPRRDWPKPLVSSLMVGW